MGAEFDGAEHRTRERHRRDVRRLDDFQRAGLEIATFVGADLDDERLVVERLRATRARAGRLPRTWCLAPPGPSLDERLDDRDAMIALAEGEERLVTPEDARGVGTVPGVASDGYPDIRVSTARTTTTARTCP